MSIRIIDTLEPLGNFPVANTKDIQSGEKRLDVVLGEKQNAETGKGLSTNDYTTSDKEKLAGIAAGATKTVVDASLSSTSTNAIQNKAVNSALSGKVDAVSGKGLSTNDYTTSDKEKLAGIAAGATKTVVDASLSSTSTNAIQNKAVNSALSGKADQSYVEESLALHSERINTKASQTSVDAIATRVSTNETNISANSARIDTFATLTDGSTTGDAELTDGRVGADGTTYTNIGGAIRGQVNDINSDLSLLEINTVSDSLYMQTSTKYNQGTVHTINSTNTFIVNIKSTGTASISKINMEIILSDDTKVYRSITFAVGRRTIKVDKNVKSVQLYTESNPTASGTMKYSIIYGYGLNLCDVVKTNSEITQDNSTKILEVGTKTMGLNEEHSIQVTAGTDIKTTNYSVYIQKGTKYTVTITPSALNSVSTIAFYKNGKAVAYPSLTNGAWTYTEKATKDITQLGINNTKEYNTNSCTISYKIESVGLVSEVNQNTVDIRYTKVRTFGLTSENTIQVKAGAAIEMTNYSVYIPKGTEYSVTITPSELDAVKTIAFFKNGKAIAYPSLKNGAFKFSETAGEDIVTLGINNTKEYNVKNCTVSFNVVAKGVTNEIADMSAAIQPVKPTYTNAAKTVNVSSMSLEETYIEIGSRLTAILTWNDSFGNINVGRGKSTFRGMWLSISSTNCDVYIKDYVTGDEQSGTTLSDKLLKTYTHGLNLKSPVTVIIESNENSGSIKRDIKLVNGDGNVFSQQLTGISGATGTPFAESVSGGFNVNLSFTTSNYDKKIWMYGDSYFEYRWLPTLRSWGHTNFLADYRAGQASAEAYRSLTNAFKHGNPRVVVWAEGMNDGSDSNESTPNSTWLSSVQSAINLCSSKGADIVLCTIPSVYYNGSFVKDHRAKNAWIRSSGYRYCDFSSVLEDGNGNWFDGLKNPGNDVHPSTLGCNVMAAYAMNSIPELSN